MQGSSQRDAVASETILPEHLSAQTRYKLFSGCIVPRPIALVTSLSPEGVINAAPFSQFFLISSEPPLLGIIVGQRDGGYRDGQSQDNGPIKDTLTNISRLGEYVINTAPEELALAVQLCADELPPEQSEIGHAGLHVVPSTRVRVPRVAESKVQFECQLHRMVPFAGASTLIAGEVVMIHTAPGLIDDGRVDIGRYAPLGRIGGRNYCRLTDLVSV